MTRKECLDKAAQCVLKDRNNQYGGPENSFNDIANFWSVYLGRKIYPVDVAMMMSLLKIARIKGNRCYGDGYVDLAGYAACGAECASGKPAPAPKAEGVEELVQKDAPQTSEESCQRIKDKRKEALLEMREILWDSCPFHAKIETAGGEQVDG